MSSASDASPGQFFVPRQRQREERHQTGKMNSLHGTPQNERPTVGSRIHRVSRRLVQLHSNNPRPSSTAFRQAVGVLVDYHLNYAASTYRNDGDPIISATLSGPMQPSSTSPATTSSTAPPASQPQPTTRAFYVHRAICIALFACGPVGAIAAVAIIIATAFFTEVPHVNLIVKTLASATTRPSSDHSCLIDTVSTNQRPAAWHISPCAQQHIPIPKQPDNPRPNPTQVGITLPPIDGPDNSPASPHPHRYLPDLSPREGSRLETVARAKVASRISRILRCA